MKQFFLVLTLVSFLSACNRPVKGTNGETYKTPVQYNDYIVSRQSTLMQKLMDFGRVAETSLDEADKVLDTTVIQIGKMVEEIKGMPVYKGDSTLRNAAINTFTFYQKLVGTQYKQIIQYRKEGGDTSEVAAAKIKEIVDQISVEEEKYDKAFHNAQRNFAEKNNMKLMENQMQKEIDKLNKEN